MVKFFRKRKASKSNVKQSKSAVRSRKLTRKQNRKKLKAIAKKKQLPSTWKLMKASLGQIKDNKKLFGGILIIYFILIIVFVRGISGNFQLSTIQQNVVDTFGEQTGKWEKGAASYGLLLGSAVSSQTEVESIYQTIIIVITSLALIWGLRQTYNRKQKVKIRDSFYKGMYPLVPFILVIFVVLIYLLPFGIASSIFSAIQANGIATTGPEQIAWWSVLIAGALISAYLALAGIFAVYIATLPDMSPIKALKEANALVRFRRWQVARKFIILTLTLLVLSAVVLIPMIVFFAKAAEIIYLLFSIVFLVYAHAFIYRLYRELI